MKTYDQIVAEVATANGPRTVAALRDLQSRYIVESMRGGCSRTVLDQLLAEIRQRQVELADSAEPLDSLEAREVHTEGYGRHAAGPRGGLERRKEIR